MGSPVDQNNQKTNTLLGRYKIRVLEKLDDELELYKTSSPSWIFFNRVFGSVVDLLGWIFLIVALYLYLKSGRGVTTTLSCDMISPDFCNTCFVYGKELTRSVGANFSGMIGGLINGS